jgi:hypothetical protein
MATAHHTLDIYGVEIDLVTTRREWSTLRRRLSFLDKDPTQYGGLTTFAVWQPKDGLTVPHLVFWINTAQHGDQASLIDTLAHEASHGAGRILDNIEHKVEATDEPHAYLVGWLTAWLWTAVS